MASERLHKRILICLKFLAQYIFCILFRELPHLLTMKRKSVVDQVVVITGGGMGIGKALAQKFALEQKAVEEGLRTVAQITEDGGRAYFFQCNVTKPDELRLCAQQIISDTNIGS
ncbi:unnamed protein product [Gongylonema pulchrum]|uniref:KR domain-containing protein n=1 Tax=Gongylonema pulchrum TaxID=637853 RepID=A0A183EFQ7_9BILA|nr:unnamed protein product [Gongylonema pulchrum]